MNLKEILSRAATLQENLDAIRAKIVGSVMFVDLVGSTEYKANNPNEEAWLVRLAVFLDAVTQIVENQGRVVKYIGDEVMAFFDGDSAVLHAEQCAEAIFEFCRTEKVHAFQVKIAMDFGSVSMLTFGQATRGRAARQRASDPNGLVVDRCARIAGKVPAGVALCSEEFRNKSAVKAKWKEVGQFVPKGMKAAQKVFQLQIDGAPECSVKTDEMTLEQCLIRLREVEGYLNEAKGLRRPMSRLK